jgi:hypothetical protein
MIEEDVEEDDRGGCRGGWLRRMVEEDVRGG